MKEAEFNGVVKDSIISRGGFAYKISDSSANFGQKRPFDGFGVLKDRNIYWEGKLAKGFKAFNLKEIFEGERGHQMETMGTISNLTPNSDIWVPYACYEPRNTKVFLFEFKALKDLFYEEGVASLHVKVLKKLSTMLIKKEGQRRIIIGELIPISANEIKIALE